MTSRRQQQKEDTRTAILQAAYNLFADIGYEKTTMRSLATEAGVGLGTIFKHFPDKPALLATAFEQDLQGVIITSFSTLPPQNIEQQLLHVVQSIYGFYAKNPQLSSTLVKEALFLRDDYGRAMEQQVTLFLSRISTLFDQAKLRGEIGQEFESHQGSLAFWSFYLTGLLLGLKQESFDIETQAALVAGLLHSYLTGYKPS